jgi:hypothetical protein
MAVVIRVMMVLVYLNLVLLVGKVALNVLGQMLPALGFGGG